MNNWKTIWNRRKPVTGGLSGDQAHVFLELKRLNGYDVMGEGIPLDSFLNFIAGLMEHLDLTAGKSVYEVGCGAGANLYRMAHEGLTVGGSDYAEGLIETARAVLPEARELVAMEAADIPTEEKYDAVFSCGVFSYFPDHAYAARVLEHMLTKSTHVIGVTDIHDRTKRQEYLDFRRASIPDYDARYEGLSRLFFRRSFFEEFAAQHDLRVTFPALELAGYWNTPFSFNVFMYRQ
ncbi:methyltransferase domain protein [Selenomonas sp. FOBRC6]|uniref:class I SAM-dependent methyltransferase n=1 Tax=Selenomonas sp. FOBRC6 TaxID=936572 RepID=UPI0002781567|nr:class I SAM-dependent methyltransferase [Selenomonas sp. FOBRC6]EJO23277.1 methyltransferase domain protein [Selenomonas sp. FOBRC6]